MQRRETGSEQPAKADGGCKAKGDEAGIRMGGFEARKRGNSEGGRGGYWIGHSGSSRRALETSFLPTYYN
ncbi:unnamed protein product [Sympodiomycopsis kandeliae]